MDNTGYRNDLETSALVWEAAEAGGAVHRFGASSADKVAAGKATEIHVRFTLPDGPASLAQLRYRGHPGAGDAAIPAYS